MTHESNKKKRYFASTYFVHQMEIFRKFLSPSRRFAVQLCDYQHIKGLGNMQSSLLIYGP